MHTPAVTCVDCHTALAPGEATRPTESGPVCVPCAELRDLAFRSLAGRQQAASGVRRGPRHPVPCAIAARIVMSGGGALGSTEPLLEISRHGFRVATLRRMDAGERLECAAALPGDGRIEFEVEVRWCRREGAHWEIGVEVEGTHAQRFERLYAAQVAVIEAP